jgi:hypothetical protein
MGMVVQTMKIRRCDVCGSLESPASPYRLGRLGEDPRTETLDLCEEHASPVEELFDAKPPARKRGRPPVVTKEQIAAKKRTAKKA